jgi:hypothetical protein
VWQSCKTNRTSCALAQSWRPDRFCSPPWEALAHAAWVREWVCGLFMLGKDCNMSLFCLLGFISSHFASSSLRNSPPCPYSPPINNHKTDDPTPPLAPTVSQATPTSVMLTWPPSAGNAYAVDYYHIQYKATDNAAAPWSTYQCAGGQLPVRLDGGSMALATW